jgi:hypothetical protein
VISTVRCIGASVVRRCGTAQASQEGPVTSCVDLAASVMT